MGDAIAKRDSMTMVKNIEGRYTDGKMGGTRSQTYTLNTAGAKLLHNLKLRIDYK